MVKKSYLLRYTTAGAKTLEQVYNILAMLSLCYNETVYS